MTRKYAVVLPCFFLVAVLLNAVNVKAAEKIQPAPGSLDLKTDVNTFGDKQARSHAGAVTRHKGQGTTSLLITVPAGRASRGRMTSVTKSKYLPVPPPGAALPSPDGPPVVPSSP